VTAEKILDEDELNKTEDVVDDETETDDVTPPIRFDVTSYGADLDVEGLVRRRQ
jgi:hypothetical protein